MFYGFKDSKCYRLLKRTTSAICTMCILFNLFPMSTFNAYAAEGGESSTITKNTISADGEIQLMDGWFLEKITNDVTSSGSYADDYDTGFYNDIKSNYENGYNSEDTALEIGTAKQLAAFSKYVNDGNDFSSKYVKLVDNIDLNLNENLKGIQYDKDEDNANKKLTVKVFGSVSHKWNPIGNNYDKTFKGTFLGNNHTIKNMLTDSGSYCGLFGYVDESGVIKDVNVKRSMVSASSDVRATNIGGIAGRNGGTISNCTNSGAVSSSVSYVEAGGIAGENYGGTISNCTNSGAVSVSTVSSSLCAGGIAGFNGRGTISNCTNSGAVSSSMSSSDPSTISILAGGIAGSSGGTISNCTNSGAIYSSSVARSSYVYTGGIVGNDMRNNGTINNCTNSGAVSSSVQSSSSSAYAGGIIGCIESGKAEYCLSTSEKIECSTAKLGGVAGGLFSSATISYCYYDKDIISGVSKAISNSEDTESVKGVSTTELNNGKSLFPSDAMWLYKSGNYPILDRINRAITPSITIDDAKGAAIVSYTTAEEYKGYYDTVNYSWYKEDGTKIEGETEKNYTLRSGDENSKISCRIYATSESNYCEVVANVTKKVHDLSISDISASIGFTAKDLKDCVKNPDSLNITYQYKVKDADYSTYTVLPDDNTVINPGSYTLRVTYVTDNTNTYYGKILDKDFVVARGTLTEANFKFTPPADEDLVYNGQEKAATVVANDGVTGIGTITVNYYKDGNPVENNKAIDVGTYIVKINVAENDKYFGKQGLKDASWTFKITEAKVANVETPSAKSDVKYGTKLSEVTLEDGWHWADGETVPSVGKADYAVYYDMPYDSNYDYSAVEGYSQANNRVERSVSVETVVDKSDWGKPAEPKYDNVENYVSEDGTISAEVKENGLVWIANESNESTEEPIWYAIDNSNEIFEKGSRFEVRRLDEKSSQDDRGKYKKFFDDERLNEVDQDKLEIFLVSVTGPDGKKYTRLDSDLSLYVKLADDWDKDNIAAVFLGEGNNEDIDLEYIDSMACPGETGKFVKLTLKHFSPYAIYAKKSGNSHATVKTTTNTSNNTKSSKNTIANTSNNTKSNKNTLTKTSNSAKTIKNIPTDTSNNANSSANSLNVNSLEEQTSDVNKDKNLLEKQTNDGNKDESVSDQGTKVSKILYSVILGTAVVAVISGSSITLLRKRKKM